MNDAVFVRIRGWAAAPFNRPLDLASFLLFTVLALTLSYMWSRVLHGAFGD